MIPPVSFFATKVFILFVLIFHNTFLINPTQLNEIILRQDKFECLIPPPSNVRHLRRI